MAVIGGPLVRAARLPVHFAQVTSMELKSGELGGKCKASAPTASAVSTK